MAENIPIITPSLVQETAESPKYFIAIIEDISDRKQAEARLKEASQALAELTELYQLAVTGSGDGIWDWDLKTGDSYLSPRWKEILGYQDDEVSNHADSFFSYLHPEDKKGTIIKGKITKDIIPELTYPHTNNKVNSCDLTFRIKDTGKGIAEENLSNIFDAFVQAGNNQEYCDGTGLGLAISKNYVDLMGGHMQIQSSLGKGTTVEFDIPITIIPKEEFVESLPKGRITGLEPNQPKRLVLIVEDNSDNHQLLFEILSEVGFETIQAHNGKEAVEKWQKYKPDLILMDMQMPVMNGYQATREIRSTVEGKNTTIIIAQTSNAFNEDKKLIMSLGCDDFISKPFQEQVLLEKVAYHLGVKYTYSNEKQDLEPENLPIQITPESLAFMSDKWRFQLHQIASTCNKKDILKILAEIPEDNSSNSQVKQYLMSLANKFLFDVIVDLTAPLEEINSR